MERGEPAQVGAVRGSLLFGGFVARRIERHDRRTIPKTETETGAHVCEETVHLVLALVVGQKTREDGDHLSSAGVGRLDRSEGPDEAGRGWVWRKKR